MMIGQEKQVQVSTGRSNKGSKHVSPVRSHLLIDAFEHLAFGTLECIFPNGVRKVFRGTQAGIAADIRIYDWRVLDRILADGDIGLGEEYVAGRWDTGNLSALLQLMLDNFAVLKRFFHNQRLHQFHRRLAHYLLAKARSNTLAGSRKNIHAHYDLGNDFYKLWLDDSLTYSCALFHGDVGKNLEDAQRAKYQRILDKLGAVAGDHVLDIGCGWGGFAQAAAAKGRKVTGVTISREQYALAVERLRRKNLDAFAEIRLQDYRDVDEQYDHIVSIGMFEHVGEAFWPIYMKKVHSCMKDMAKAVIQTITIHDDLFNNYRKKNDFIRKHVFPGGMLPSEKRFRQEAGKAGLNVVEVFHFGKDYALTLQHWQRRFEQALGEVRALGYCERFIRKWRFYLVSCQAAFTVGRVSVMQVLLTK